MPKFFVISVHIDGRIYDFYATGVNERLGLVKENPVQARSGIDKYRADGR